MRVSATVTVSELAVAAELDYLRVGADLDRVVALDLIDQVARHRLPEIVAADQQPAARGCAGEEHRRLPGRVAAADDHDRIAGAQLRLGLGGGVVDAARLELLEPRHVEAPVLSAGRDDDGPTGRDLAVGERDLVPAAARSSAARPRPATARRAPNLTAWTPARWASSLPETPAGKPR